MVKVKLFDCEHEKDLEKDMNEFLKNVPEKNIIDIKYEVAEVGEDKNEQVYCFSAMIIYQK